MTAENFSLHLLFFPPVYARCAAHKCAPFPAERRLAWQPNGKYLIFHPLSPKADFQKIRLPLFLRAQYLWNDSMKTKILYSGYFH